MKLLELDLDQAEDKQAQVNVEKKHLEAHEEELIRENKQFQHRINVLEGKSWRVPECTQMMSLSSPLFKIITFVDIVVMTNNDDDRCWIW